MTWHHPALAKDALAESDAEIKMLRAENEQLRDKVATAATELLAICDGSNWPAEAQSGVGYRLYTDLTGRLHEIANDLRSAITAGKDV